MQEIFSQQSQWWSVISAPPDFLFVVWIERELGFVEEVGQLVIEHRGLSLVHAGGHLVLPSRRSTFETAQRLRTSEQDGTTGQGVNEA
jgi:hypothetical protein